MRAAMLEFIDDLVCQLFHGKWAEVVSYSRQGAWRCTRSGCAAQARHDQAARDKLLRTYTYGKRGRDGYDRPSRSRSSVPGHR